MHHSIYCSPTHFRLITGEADSKTLRVRRYAKLMLPVDGMINGIITDCEQMTNFFTQIRNEYALGNVPTSLVINNNNIQAKRLEVPPVSEDMILEFVRREFTQHSEEGSDNIYDYKVLSPHGPKGGTRILAVGVPKELIVSYMNTLISAGFDLRKIDIGLNCQIKLAKFLPQLRNSSVILALIDGRSLTLTLFENGEYRVSNRYRLIHEAGTQPWIEEVGGNISSMVQFNKTQKDNAQVTAAYIAGAEEMQTNALRFALSYLGIDVLQLNLSNHVKLQQALGEDADEFFDINEYLLNIGNFLRK